MMKQEERQSNTQFDQEADLFLEGGKVLNVYSGEVLDSNLIVKGERIWYVGPRSDSIGEKTLRLDVSGKVLVPGYVEPHCHPWNIYNPVSLGEEFCRLGTTTLVCDDLIFYMMMGPERFEEFKLHFFRQAADIIGDERDALGAAGLIKQWVYRTIEKKPTLSIPSALDVLKLKVGDCNEHTVLYVALCRAAGIPSRFCAGLVYSQGSFYYHAWAEVFAGRWVSVDPTLDQLPADATHIRLVEGELDRQLEIVRLIGVLKVEVIEYR